MNSSSPQVSEAMLQAGNVAAKGFLANSELSAIYLAMEAARTPDGPQVSEAVARAIDEARGHIPGWEGRRAVRLDQASAAIAAMEAARTPSDAFADAGKPIVDMDEVREVAAELQSCATALEVVCGGVTLEASKNLPKITPLQSADIMLKAANLLHRVSEGRG